MEIDPFSKDLVGGVVALPSCAAKARSVHDAVGLEALEDVPQFLLRRPLEAEFAEDLRVRTRMNKIE